MASENIINTSSKAEINYNFNDLPVHCLFLISTFIDTDKNCLRYRNISKKFNEAIQVKLYMKSKEDDLVFYKKCFLILNSNCHNYYLNNIYPFLLNAETVYEFFNYKNEKTFKDLFNYCFNELKSIINLKEMKIEEDNDFDKTFKQSVIRFLVSIILKNFEEEEYDSLDFSKLNPYQEAKEMILLIIRLMKNLNYLDLSDSIINDDNFISKLLDKIQKKDKFTLILEGIDINKNLVKKIKIINDTNLDIKIKINNIYNGQLHFYGGKKMNKEKNKNKKKFKNIEFK
jgi:hypothetical protein